MRVFGKIPMGRDGFPVEFIENSPVRNFIRLLILTNWKNTKAQTYERHLRLQGSVAGTQGNEIQSSIPAN